MKTVCLIRDEQMDTFLDPIFVDITAEDHYKRVCKSLVYATDEQLGYYRNYILYEAGKYDEDKGLFSLKKDPTIVGRFDTIVAQIEERKNGKSA